MTQSTSQNVNASELINSVSIYSANNEELAPEIFRSLSRIGSSYPAQGESVLAKNIEKKIARGENQLGTQQKKNYSYAKKAGYLALMGIAGFMGPLASNMNIPALNVIASDFRTSYSTASITVTIFLISIGIGPLIWGMLSDAYGRKWLSVFSMIIFALGSVGCALSTSIDMLIVMRFIQGLGSSASMVIGIGTITDIFPKSEMGRAIGLFTVGPLLGPAIGPIIGGYMAQYTGWRSLFYLSTGFAAMLAILIAVFYEETMASSRKLPAPITRSIITGKLELSKELPNPFSCLLFLRHIDIALLCTWTGLIFGSYYANTIAQPITVGTLYHLSTSQVGLTFIAAGVGNMLGAIISGYTSDYFVNRYIRNSNGQASPPELRLKLSIAWAVIIIAALLMNGWFINYNFHLAAILFAQFLIGFSMSSIFNSISNYYVEAFPTKSSSVYACNSSFRVIFAAIISAITPPILNEIGVGYTFTFFAGLEVLGLVILILMILFGQKIRSITRK